PNSGAHRPVRGADRSAIAAPRVCESRNQNPPPRPPNVSSSLAVRRSEQSLCALDTPSSHSCSTPCNSDVRDQADFFCGLASDGFLAGREPFDFRVDFELRVCVFLLALLFSFAGVLLGSASPSPSTL